MLQKRKEQMDIDAKITASNAKLSVLRTFEQTASQWILWNPMSADKQDQQLHLFIQKLRQSQGLQCKAPQMLQPASSHHVQQHASSRPRSTASVDGGRFGFTQNMLQKHQEITELLIQQQGSQHLIPREITVFEGDPLQFSFFTKAFKHCVEEKTNNKGDCLYFLERYTRGRPREIV